MVGVVFECDAAEEEGDDTGHREAVGKEITRVRAKRDKASLDRGIVVEVGMFEEERHPEAECNAKGH